MAIAKQTTATVIPALQYQDAPAAIDDLATAPVLGHGDPVGAIVAVGL